MKTVKISIHWGEFKTLKVQGKKVKDFEMAIDVARALKVSNIRLEQKGKGCCKEWDNF